MPQYDYDPIKVLLVEDDPAAAQLSEAILDEQGAGMFAVTHVLRLREALQQLKNATFDVVLLDLSLPDAHGLEGVIQLQDQDSDVPVVVLTALDDEALGVEAVKQGAQDYLVKGQASAAVLMHSMRYAIERKRSEVALQASEERYQLLFESAPDGYYINDLKGVFIDGNRVAEELIGYQREELIGKSFLKLKLLPPKQIPKAAALLAQSALGKPTGPSEFTLNRKDGSQKEVEIRTFPIMIDDQAVVLGIARDITERKRANEQAQQLAALEERQRLARDLHDGVSQSLSAALVIAGVLNMAMESDPDGSTQRIDMLVDALKEAAVEMGSLLVELQPAALVEGEISDLLQRLTASISGRAETPIDLKVEGTRPLSSDVQIVLYRIAQEALNNAVKHADASQITVRLTCSPEQVKLRVSDDGVGFDPAQRGTSVWATCIIVPGKSALSSTSIASRAAVPS